MMLSPTALPRSSSGTAAQRPAWPGSAERARGEPGVVISRQNWTQKRVFLLCKQQRPTCQFLWQEEEKTIFGTKYLVNLRTQESRAPAGCAWGWHSPDGLQAPLDGLGGNKARGCVVDLMGQAEAHLQPAVDVEPHHARSAQAAESGPSATHIAAPSRAHKPHRHP